MSCVCSLDKDLFTNGLDDLQSRVNRRFYTSAMAFAQDLGDVIGTRIANAPSSAHRGGEPRTEVGDASPAKTNFSDIRERRKLGKRILKAVQPLLEAALRVESEISNKPYETLQKELDNLVEASIDTSRIATTSDTTKQEEGEDTIMVDAVDSSEITVKSGPIDAGASGDPDADGDPMDTTEDGAEGQDAGNIQVNTSGLGIVNVKPEEPPTASPRKSKRGRSNGPPTSETPPGSEEYANLAPSDVQTGPPTPPQSNGSLGKEPLDPLTDGGVLWYLKSMQPQGTSILGEHWVGGRDAVRMLSEELTDLDDEELKGLRAEVDESVKAAGLDLNGLSDTGSTKAKASAKPRKRRASGRRR